jgi:hypothetical protein
VYFFTAGIRDSGNQHVPSFLNGQKNGSLITKMMDSSTHYQTILKKDGGAMKKGRKQGLFEWSNKI